MQAQMQVVLSGLVWVALGGVLGGTARLFVSGFVGRRIGETFPWGTIVVNITGAFAIGIIAAAADAHVSFDALPPWQFAVVGILGCYTTVSSFSLQTLALARNGEVRLAAANVLLSVVGCLAAAASGYAMAALAIRHAP